jgi:hypothetical protein
MTTPTERRLAITPGEAKHYGDGYVEVRRGDRMAIRFNPEGYTPGQQGFIQSVDDAALYADAHNTYNACHLTPSELLAKLREAAAMIVRIGYSCDDLGHRKDQYHNWDQPCPVVAEIDAFLSNLPK